MELLYIPDHACRMTPDEEGAERIIEARKSAGLSKAALAKACGVSWPTVNSWEKGEYAPNAENLEKIAKATGRTMSWIQTGTDNSSQRAHAAVESHVEPVNEHPHFTRARRSGHYPEWVLKAADVAFFQRDGQFKYHQLVRFMDAIHEAGEESFEAGQPGPPKR